MPPVSMSPPTTTPSLNEISLWLKRLKDAGLFNENNELIPEAFKAFNEKVNPQKDAVVKSDSSSIEEYDPTRPLIDFESLKQHPLSQVRSRVSLSRSSWSGAQSLNIRNGTAEQAYPEFDRGSRIRVTAFQDAQTEGFRRGESAVASSDLAIVKKPLNPYLDERRIDAAERRQGLKKRPRISDAQLLKPLKEAKTTSLSPSPIKETPKEELLDSIDLSPSASPLEPSAPIKMRKLSKRQEQPTLNEDDSDAEALASDKMLRSKTKHSISDETDAVTTESAPIIGVTDADTSIVANQPTEDAINKFTDSLPKHVLKLLLDLKGANNVMPDPLMLGAAGFQRSSRHAKPALDSSSPEIVAEKPDKLEKLPTRSKQRVKVPRSSPLPKKESSVSTEREDVVEGDTIEVQSSPPPTTERVSAADGTATFTEVTPRMARELEKLKGHFAKGYYENYAGTIAEEAFSITGRRQRATRALTETKEKSKSPAPEKRKAGRPRKKS